MCGKSALMRGYNYSSNPALCITVITSHIDKLRRYEIWLFVFLDKIFVLIWNSISGGNTEIQSDSNKVEISVTQGEQFSSDFQKDPTNQCKLHP